MGKNAPRMKGKTHYSGAVSLREFSILLIAAVLTLSLVASVGFAITFQPNDFLLNLFGLFSLQSGETYNFQGTLSPLSSICCGSICCNYDLPGIPPYCGSGSADAYLRDNGCGTGGGGGGTTTTTTTAPPTPTGEACTIPSGSSVDLYVRVFCNSDGYSYRYEQCLNNVWTNVGSESCRDFGYTNCQELSYYPPTDSRHVQCYNAGSACSQGWICDSRGDVVYRYSDCSLSTPQACGSIGGTCNNGVCSSGGGGTTTTTTTRTTTTTTQTSVLPLPTPGTRYNTKEECADALLRRMSSATTCIDCNLFVQNGGYWFEEQGPSQTETYNYCKNRNPNAPSTCLQDGQEITKGNDLCCSGKISATSLQYKKPYDGWGWTSPLCILGKGDVNLPYVPNIVDRVINKIITTGCFDVPLTTTYVTGIRTETRAWCGNINTADELEKWKGELAKQGVNPNATSPVDDVSGRIHDDIVDWINDSLGGAVGGGEDGECESAWNSAITVACGAGLDAAGLLPVVGGIVRTGCEKATNDYFKCKSNLCSIEKKVCLTDSNEIGKNLCGVKEQWCKFNVEADKIKFLYGSIVYYIFWIAIALIVLYILRGVLPIFFR